MRKDRHMKRNLLIVTVMFISLILTGCGLPKVLNLPNQKVERKISKDAVYMAIYKAGMRRGWEITKLSDGHAKGVVLSRGHEATILIDYTDTSYSISYKSSKKLNYDAKTDKIHSAYNRWILGLKRQIDKEISSLSLHETLHTAHKSIQPVEELSSKNKESKEEEETEEFKPVQSSGF